MQRSTGNMTSRRHGMCFGSPRFQTSHYVLLLRSIHMNRWLRARAIRRERLRGPMFDSVREAFHAGR